MSKTESAIRFIFGAERMDVRPLVYAIDIAIELMFFRGIPMDDISVTKDVYPDVAKLLKKRSRAAPSVGTVAKRLQRLSNRCWDLLVARGLVVKYLGTPLNDIRAPRDMIFYLAFYCHLGTPFFVAIEEEPTLLF